MVRTRTSEEPTRQRSERLFKNRKSYPGSSWRIDSTARPCVNTLRPGQNDRRFPDEIFKWIFLNENVWISINIWLKFVPKGPINNIPALVQIMAWRRSGDKPLSEPIMVSLLTHIRVTRPQWVKCLWIKCTSRHCRSSNMAPLLGPHVSICIYFPGNISWKSIQFVKRCAFGATIFSWLQHH